MNKNLMALIQPELTEVEIRQLCRDKKEDLGFDIEKALYPLNPLTDILDPTINIEDAVCLVEERASVRASVRDSVRASVGHSVGHSVWDSVWDSVGHSVRHSVGHSVWDSVWAYSSSVFYGIENWEGVDHEPGVNPFQPAIDLWEAGYIASNDGDTWRLHCGPEAKIVWEGKVTKP